MLTLRITQTSDDGPDARPIQYEVLGLPVGRRALISRLSGVWKVLRIRDGLSESSWSGAYESPDDALRSLEPDATS